MATIPIGTAGEYHALVTGDIAVNFLGNEDARVLGTPFLIGFLEMTCRNSVLDLLEEGYDTVGTEVNVKHLAATPMGMQVTFRSVVTAVEERRVRFAVEAYDDKEKISEGTHERFIIHVARFAARLQAKLVS
ncbi:MAG: thioesterase family protein [Bryobacterales bacterium]|nr:thioesterase family protein [Bryobacterales bacterium]